MNRKFTERDLGQFVSDFFTSYQNNPNQKFFFNFSQYERISNQNLLILTALFKYLYSCGHAFEIKLFGDNPAQINKRQAETIIQIWEVWKLRMIFDRRDDSFEKYIVGYNNSIIPFLIKKFKIKVGNNIYDRLGITPFVYLDKIDKYNDDKLLSDVINPVFKLNQAILHELNIENSTHPFLENTLSAIVTRELYENFLDHYKRSFFKTEKDMCFMSISLKRKLGREAYFVRKEILVEINNNFTQGTGGVSELIQKYLKKNDSSIVKISHRRFKSELSKIGISSSVQSRILDLVKKDDFQNKQRILSLNIEEEEIPLSRSFFCDEQGEFTNKAYIQYTFIDFGQGISNSLLDTYLKETKKNDITIFNQPDDNEILKFAFKHNSSRHPIQNRLNETNRFIPRGLFDVLTIAKRYRGLLIVRSNYGKLLFDFKRGQGLNEAVKYFGNSSNYFPGTYLTLYIPEMIEPNKFDRTVIRHHDSNFKGELKPKNINIFSLLGSEYTPKRALYSDSINKLKTELKNETSQARLNYISFFGIKDRRLIEKLIFFLLTDYEININNSVVIVHPPEQELIKHINNEVLFLSEEIKNYKIHPLPLIYYNQINHTVDLEWIGIYDKSDKKVLDSLLFEEFSIAISELIDASNVEGNTNYVDEYGNILSNIPSATILDKYYSRHTEELVKEAFDKFSIMKFEGLYLCSGNYYQDRFLHISEILDNWVYRDVFAAALFDKIKVYLMSKLDSDENSIKQYLFDSDKNSLEKIDKRIRFIAVTSSSHKLVKSFWDQGLVKKNMPNESLEKAQCINFDNYLKIESEDNLKLLSESTHYVIISDAISTGNLIGRIEGLVKKKRNTDIICVATIVNLLDLDFEDSKSFQNSFENRLLSLSTLPIKKKRLGHLNTDDYKKNLIRINPFTNSPITFEEVTTQTDSIIFYKKNKSFIDLVDENDLNLRFQIHNNLIHPYYFNIGSILEKENDKIESKNLKDSIIYALLVNNEIRSSANIKDYVIFYPKGSGIEYLDMDLLNSRINKNHSISFFELERFSTKSGWKFPHSSNYYKGVVEKTKDVLVLDDGTCTGDSIYQMINEISYFEPEHIDLLCIISRVNDYKREFLSKLNNFKKHSDKKSKISINILFGCQWHIPTFYIENNPYSDEIKWLKNLLGIKNVPLFIKKNAEKILKTITPSIDKTEDYKYFPVRRSDGKIPKKEIFLTRNEIGIIAGYRFYKESFDWYNSITFSGNRINHHVADETKDIELLSMCLLYEPYLYERISDAFPDIKFHLEKFIENIFFDIEGSQKINIKTELCFDWSKNEKDLIHLFFIIYKGSTLLKFLREHDDILLSFLEFAGDNQKTLDYILYKLSFYFPIEEDRLKEPVISIKSILQERLSFYPSRPEADTSFSERIKRFNYYTSTLISSKTDDSFENLKSRIENYLYQIENVDYHNVGIQNDKTLITGHLNEIGRKLFLKESYEKNLVLLKQKSEENLIPYIIEILHFSETYKDYFVFQEDYDSLNTKDDSLRALLSDYQTIIYEDGAKNTTSAKDIIQLIYSRFFSENFFLYQVISAQMTQDIITIIKDNIEHFKYLNPDFAIDSNIDKIRSQVGINFPYVYTEGVMRELFSNFRHSNKNISLQVKIQDDKLILNVSNEKQKNKTRGTNSGTLLFDKLRDNQIFNCDCQIKETKDEYFQTLIFKIFK